MGATPPMSPGHASRNEVHAGPDDGRAAAVRMGMQSAYWGKSMSQT